jgi:hypothetical protein
MGAAGRGVGRAQDASTTAAALKKKRRRQINTAQYSRMRPLRMPFDVDRAGTLLVVLLTVVTLAAAATVGVMKTAALDMRVQLDSARQTPVASARSPLGQASSALLASDIAPGDYSALEVRTNELEHRSDRLLEATAVVALVGMLAGLLVTPPASAARRAREQTMPLAKTRRSGTV